MTKEQRFKTMVWAGALCLILASIYVGVNLGPIYLAVFFVVIFCAFLLILVEFYLRIQHNIDASVDAASTVSNVISVVNEETIRNNNVSSQNAINEVSKIIDSKLKEEKELHEEIVGFFDNLLNYLEENKKDTEKIGENVKLKLEESKDLQSKTIVLMRQILEHQKDQTLFLKEEIAKLKNEQKQRADGIEQRNFETLDG